MKSLDHVDIDSENCFYLILNIVNVYIKESNGHKLMLNYLLKYNMWKNNNHFLTNPSGLVWTTHPRNVSAYYQVMFNTDEQFLFYNFIMIIERNKLTRLNKLTSNELKPVRSLYQIGTKVQN